MGLLKPVLAVKLWRFQPAGIGGDFETLVISFCEAFFKSRNQKSCDAFSSPFFFHEQFLYLVNHSSMMEQGLAMATNVANDQSTFITCDKVDIVIAENIIPIIQIEFLVVKNPVFQLA